MVLPSTPNWKDIFRAALRQASHVLDTAHDLNEARQMLESLKKQVEGCDSEEDLDLLLRTVGVNVQK
jgi:hypothetical protein